MKKKALIISTLLCAMSFSRSYAISEFDINKKTLDEVLDRQTYDLEFESYLKSKNIETHIYETIIGINQVSELKIYDWYKIDSGLIFYDEILFSHPKIKSLYEEIQSENPNNTLSQNRQIVRKELISSLDSIQDILKESISKYADLKNIFKMTFKRLPNEKELQWLKDINTLKYAAYSGKLNRELTEDDFNKINNSQGYKLMDYEFEDYDELNILRQVEEIIQDHEIKYYKIYKEFDVIHFIINIAFQVDIFSQLSENERLNLYNESVVNMRLDKNELFSKTLKLLVKKGIISEDDFEKIENEVPSNPEYEDDNPYQDRVEELKNNKNWAKLQDSLSKKYSDIFNNLSFKILGGNSEICFKLNNKIYNTDIFINNKQDILNYKESILSKITKLFKGKSVKSKEKTMICLNNSITTYKNDVKGINYFDYLNQSLKKIGLQITLKEK